MLTAHEQKLAENYVPLAQKLANKYAQVWFNGREDDYEELASRLTEEIVRCTKSYKESRGGFSAYVHRVAHNVAAGYFAEWKQDRAACLSIGTYECEDIIEGRNYEEEVVANVMWEDFLETLEEDENYLLDLRLQPKAMTQQQIAEALTLRFGKYYSQVTVHNMLKRIRESKRKYSEKN